MDAEEMRKIIRDEVDKLLTQRFGCIHETVMEHRESGVYQKCIKCNTYIHDPILQMFPEMFPKPKTK